jgi:2-polyprenyl-6-methoxyphenol hydroxylase-like FAD-dependent oxidoreductase
MTAAIALGRRGIEAEIVEIDTDWQPSGVGLLLQSPPLRALRTIGLLRPCIAAGFVHGEVRMCDAAGNVRWVAHPPPLPDEPLPAVAIARTALHSVLARALDELGTTIRLGTTVASFIDDGGSVSVTFEDGSSATYDLVIGADGLNSRVRELAFPQAPKPIPFGQQIWRALAPRPTQLRHYPIFIGDRAKIGLVPISEQEIYVYLLENGGGASRPPREQQAALMRDRMIGYNELVDEVRAGPLDCVDFRNLSAIMVPPPWHAGRVVLIGDAVHATTPHLAFGVGMAIEDGIVLAELLAEDRPVAKTLAAFTARRFRRCRLVVESSLLLGEWEQRPVPNADPARVTREAFQALAQPI